MAYISVRISGFSFITLPLLVLVSLITAFPQCEQKADEKLWLEETVKVWKSVRSKSLKLKPADLPWLIVFDEKCVFNINPNARLLKNSSGASAKTWFLAREKVSFYSAPHNGNINLPDGQIIPADLISFAANYENNKSSFFVAALPSVWKRAQHLKDERHLETLVRAVYVHELTHTYHRNFFARLTEIEKELKEVDNFDDDLIQNTFGKNESFSKAYLDEIALAEAAVVETNYSRKRIAAKILLNAMKKRRGSFYIGDNKRFEEVEDIFLTMEGAANWAGYKAAIADGLGHEAACRLIRRSGKKWSQEEGIQLFMIIDALLPNWQRIAFGKNRVSIVDLLEKAVQ